MIFKYFFTGQIVTNIGKIYTMEENESRINRRDIIKGLLTFPALGAFAYNFFKDRKYQENLRKNILGELDIDTEKSSKTNKKKSAKNKTKPLRLGIIGVGGRGRGLLRSCGFVIPEEIDVLRKTAIKKQKNSRYKTFMEQDDLNIVFNGICEIYNSRAEYAQRAAANINRYGSDKFKNKEVKRYKNYKKLIHSDDIDAVIIATPDHWHAPITIEAANAGKHVYCEKCMTHNLEDVYAVKKAIEFNNIVFQLGHQNRQAASYIKASELVKKNILGKITLVETSTNRNSANGAWAYPIPSNVSEKDIDWQQFVRYDKNIPFNKEHFFRWRCWWDYGTGLAGDMLTHEYDCINQVLDIGIPESVVASGGIYYWKDGREVPDVFNVTMEFPKKELTVIYSASLASQYERKRIIMGHDATLDLGSGLNVIPDAGSTRYKKEIQSKIIKPSIPMYSFQPGIGNLDAITSATQRYFAKRGLLFTSRDGKQVDTTHLHIAEWLNAIRNGGKVSCGVEQGFQEAITAQMATIAYKNGKKVFWNANEKKVNV